MTQFTGKIALVTGGARNVGKAIARELAARGAHILLNYFHSHDAAKETKAELERLGATVDLLRASVAQPRQVDRMFDEIRDRHGRLDILVNNAANGALVPLEQITEASLDKALNTNFKGSLWCARRAAPLMAIHGGGSIVNISALGGSALVMANYLACGPAKAAVEALTRYLAVEFAPLNVRVNTASAGMLESEVADSFPRAAEMQEIVARSTPLGRLGRPEELARLVAFLASEDAGWITGQVLLADGGLSLGSALLSPPALPPAGTSRPVVVAAGAASPAAALEAVPSEIAAPAAARAAGRAPEAGRPEGEDDAEIAIVGMGLVVPGANDPEEYWRILSEGGNFFIDVPPDRWDNSAFLSPDHAAEDKTYQSKSAFVTGFTPCPELRQQDGDAIEHHEFTTLWLRHSLLQALRGVKRRPADRCSFVIGYTADGSQHLEEAAIVSGAAARCAGVLAGMDLPESEKAALAGEFRRALEARYARSVASPSRFLPCRVGENAMKDVLPSGTDVLMVDTACSSSLYAIDIGIKGLLTGKHDVAVCGGAFALAPRGSVLFAKLHGISTSGEVRAFDKTSDGVLFADGAGIVVLKTLRRARQDGDRVLALVRGFGASSDGKGKAIYAPSSAGQTIAIERALSRPGVEVGHIDWVIAHATGTPAGDLAEFTTLRRMIRPERPVYVTSNKSLIGHTGWAAGVVSVIQGILGLQKEIIPPQHRFTETPSTFEIDTTRLTIPREAVAWPPKGDAPRAVSISGFGFGGTNAHLVLEEYRPDAAPSAPPQTANTDRIAVVGWSAHVPGLSSRERVAAWLRGESGPPQPGFGDIYPAPRFEKVRMPPGTVRTIDRCQLMILECAHDLKAQIGEFWDRSRARTGVFVGHMGTTRNAVLYGGRCYLDEIGRLLRKSGSSASEAVAAAFNREIRRLVPASNEDSFPGSMPNVIPARIANSFDLKGPNMTVDTGFTSTFAAVEVASGYLRANEVDLALVGGINGNTTPEMQHIVHDMRLPAGTTLAEGAFLVALATETTARKAGLEILGFVDELPDGRGVAASPVGQSAGDAPVYNYLGAEGAVAILRALHQKEARRVPGRFLDSREYAPGKPLGVQRHVAVLRAFPFEHARAPIDFLPPRTLVVTDRPELLTVDPGRTDVYVLSTRPLANAAGRWHLAEVTPDAVAARLAAIDAPIDHVRLVTAMDGGSTDPWGASAESTLALHDLTFLALKGCGERLANGGSFIALFLDSVPAGALHPFAGLFAGLVKCASFELPGCVTFALFTDTTDAAAGVALAVRESSARRFLPVVVYEGDVRKAMFLNAEDAVLSPETGPRLTEESVVVAVAGARGITAEILKTVAAEFRPILYLIGSNPIDGYPPDVFEGTDAEFAARRPQYIRDERARDPRKNLGLIDRQFNRMADARVARQNIRLMEQGCGAGRVRYLACDILDRAGLQGTFDRILGREGRIDLLINAAGLNRSAPIATKAFDEFRGIRDLKARGYVNLKHVLKDRSPRIWCNFGSLLGFTGQIGEADYASGNDFLATSAQYAQQVLGADEYTIGWTLWGSVGLGAKPLTKAYFEKAGMYSNMATAEGVHHFVRELHQAPHAPSTVHVGDAEKAAINRLIPGFFPAAPRTASDAEPFYLGREIARGPGEIVFERVFDLDTDRYLAHHLVNGFATLPGTFVTEIAAEAAARLADGLEVVGFEQVEFHHFLRVYGKDAPGPKKIRATLVERSEERTVVKVRISADVKTRDGRLLVGDKPHVELNVILAPELPPSLHWEPWGTAGDVEVPDPYHFAAAPVLLTGMFASTTRTRLHPFGKRAEYRVELAPDDPVFSRFRVPCILLDGLARTGVLSGADDGYLPLVAPRTIRRIDLYERTNDCALAAVPGIQLYATPRALSMAPGGGDNRFVAARPDGRVIVQIKDVTGVVLGYVHHASGEYVTAAEMEARQRGEPLLAEAAR